MADTIPTVTPKDAPDVMEPLPRPHDVSEMAPPLYSRTNNYERVSGPSFLGLGDDTDSPDYLLEDEPRPSHTRRNIALVVVLVVVVLGALEWRSNRAGGTGILRGALHLKLPTKHAKPPEQPPAETATNSGGTQPQLVAEPVQPPGQASPTATPAAAASPSASPFFVAQAAPSPEALPTAVANTKPNSQNAQHDSAPEQSSVQKHPQPVETAKNSAPVPKAKANVPQSEPAEHPVATKTRNDVAADDRLRAGETELQHGVAAGATAVGRSWLWKATAKGNGVAPVLLAQMYLEGNGVQKNCEQAILLLQTASRKNNPRARSKLGSLYANGQCVPQDRVQAYRWMSAALDANPGSEWLDQHRESLWNQMTPGERQRARAYR